MCCSAIWGITLYLCSHLLGISPVVLTGGFFLAPTSVTVLASEERERGTAYFRCQAAGDTAHLLMGGEPVSHMGYLRSRFRGRRAVADILYQRGNSLLQSAS